MSVNVDIDTHRERTLAGLLRLEAVAEPVQAGPAVRPHAGRRRICQGAGRPGPAPGPHHRLRDAGHHHAGAGHHDRQRGAALHAGLARRDAGPGELGAHLLHRRRRHHDGALRAGLRCASGARRCSSSRRRASPSPRMLCGVAQGITDMVAYRLLQGVFGAALVPLSQAVMMDIYPPEKRGQAMAIWGMGVMLGPIMGPTLGGWLTEYYTWRWVFLINLPFGIATVLGLMAYMPDTKPREMRFDWFGFVDAEPRHRLPAADARPRREPRLVRFQRDRHRGTDRRRRRAISSSPTRRRPRSPSCRLPLFRDWNFTLGRVLHVHRRRAHPGQRRADHALRAERHGLSGARRRACCSARAASAPWPP